MRKKNGDFRGHLLLRICILLIFCILGFSLYAQEDTTFTSKTPTKTLPDSAHRRRITQKSNVILPDSVKKDTVPQRRISKNAITSTIPYTSADSLIFNMKERKVYLFNEAKVEYDDMTLEADYIEIDFKNSELYASGIADDNGKINGHPVFTQGEYSFRTHEIKYNFDTKKGKIWDVITTEGEGFIHGEQVKKMDDNTSYIKRGKYTTCELDHPHFEISFTKAKVIPNDKIVTGPAYLSFDGVPTVLAIPFGYFPIQKGRKSGFIMPTIGESGNRGFYLENGGFYFGISDNFDLAILGDIYTRGSWAAKVRSNYVVRYKCKGLINVSYAQNLFGERETDDFYKTNDFKFYWDHNQDPKSHPTTRFSAHIDIVSRSYNTYNPSSVNDYLSNQYTSKLNLTTNIRGVFFVDATASYAQNTQTGVVTLSLPDLNMSVNQFYPFRKKNKSGPLKWYDNISMKWSTQYTNQIDTYDSLLFKPETWENMSIGMKHTIPISIPIKIAKKINWNTNINFVEKWYLQATEKQFSVDTTGGEAKGQVNDIFRRKFYALHNLTLSTGLNTKVYVMYQFKKGWLNAIRHVITPNLSFSYTPNLSGNTTGTYFNTITGQEVTYSYFANSIYGGVPAKTSAIARLSFGNNIEMKVRSKKDTITGLKKVVLLESLDLSEYYDFAADSLRWSLFTISGRTTLFKQIFITFSIGFDPYCYDERGVRVNQFELQKNKRLLRFSNSNISVGVNWTLSQSTFSNSKKKKKQPEQNPVLPENSLGMPNKRPDFSTPWSITFNYSFNYSVNDDFYYYLGTSHDKYKHNIIQTLNVMGDFNITKKWKIGFTTGYDFVAKTLSYTSLDIYRDLHCWEMRFNWIPFGLRRGWSFTINVKAAVLQDLKYNKKKDFRENF